jgi:hypothetical protein
MRFRISSFVLAALIAVSGAGPQAQAGKPAGAATPQEAVATLQKASAAGDLLQALPVISPSGLRQLADEGVTGLLMVIAFSDPDDPMPGGAKPSKAELDAKRTKYKQAVDLATQVLKPYGLDTLFGKPVLSDDTQKVLNAALDKADNAALVSSLYASLAKMAPLLGMKQTPKPEPFMKAGTVSDYKINGDKATAQNLAETMNFVKIGGRWYVEPPSTGGPGGSGASSASSAAPLSAPAGQAPAAAPRAAAAGKTPEIVVGGIQVARVAVADSDFSAKPFHADNGTTIVLWIKMPAGQGLIEIDEDESVLESVTDDKGSNIGGKFASFPDEFKDGSGGIIDIESSGFAGAGATAILAEGSLALSVATGTRKTRVAKVSLQDNGKLTLGKTPIVIAEVQTQDDSQSFTLKLPRSVMNEIKAVAFFDAKGGALEGRQTGSGYMNDEAEMQLTVKTTAKVVTLEFEMWQGLRAIKVPFKVKAGLGLD